MATMRTTPATSGACTGRCRRLPRGELIEQAWQARRDDVARLLEVLADRRHVVPALQREPGRRKITEIAGERHDAGGGFEIWSPCTDIDAIAKKPLDDMRGISASGAVPAAAASTAMRRPAASRRKCSSAMRLFAEPWRHTKRTRGGGG